MRGRARCLTHPPCGGAWPDITHARAGLKGEDSKVRSSAPPSGKLEPVWSGRRCCRSRQMALGASEARRVSVSGAWHKSSADQL